MSSSGRGRQDPDQAQVRDRRQAALPVVSTEVVSAVDIEVVASSLTVA